jgi:hypothetical protein
MGSILLDTILKFFCWPILCSCGWQLSPITPRACLILIIRSASLCTNRSLLARKILPFGLIGYHSSCTLHFVCLTIKFVSRHTTNLVNLLFLWTVWVECKIEISLPFHTLKSCYSSCYKKPLVFQSNLTPE